MTRVILALLLLLHGFIHLLGFVVPWKLATVEAMPYTTTLLAGSLNIGERGVRAVGVLWLLVAIGFMIAGVGVFAGRPWAQTLTLIVALCSLILTILGWPDSYFGVLVNVVLLAYLFFGGRMGWLPLLH